MKNIGTLLMLLLFALTACTNEEDFSLPQSGGNESGTLTCRMIFYGDVTDYGGATRAGGHEWKEGDRLYIRFLGGSSTVTGCAEYSADGSWTLSYSGTLTEGAGQKCEVYYFENATHKSNTQVELTAHSAVYECSSASYNYNGEDIILSAQLSPKTGRVRFVSDNERAFTLSGISYYTSFDLGNKSFASSSAALELSTAQQGAEYSTGYVYGFYTDENTREIMLTTDDVHYVRTFLLSMLQAGKSGYITIPLAENYEGWEIDSGTLNGYDWVDLALPSGLKWATCNVGANTPDGYGNYYAWGGTSTKSSYTYDNSSTYGKEMSDISGNASYDVARKQWGSSWRLPTKAEFEELSDKNNCTWEWTTQSGVNGYKVTSKINGNSIFLPAAGYRPGTSLDFAGSLGEYWSSTPDESDTKYAYELHFYSVSHRTSIDTRGRGHSVRPVTE